jgi:hypothetical protein
MAVVGEGACLLASLRVGRLVCEDNRKLPCTAAHPRPASLSSPPRRMTAQARSRWSRTAMGVDGCLRTFRITQDGESTYNVRSDLAAGDSVHSNHFGGVGGMAVGVRRGVMGAQWMEVVDRGWSRWPAVRGPGREVPQAARGRERQVWRCGWCCTVAGVRVGEWASGKRGSLDG